MKKYISPSFWWCLCFSVFLLTALASRGQQFWNGDFDVSITLGCNCTCFCTNDMSTNNPVSMFLTANPVTSYHANTKMPPAGQLVPPHLAEFLASCTPPDYDNGNIMGLAGEGWTYTDSRTPATGLVNNPVTPSFNLSNPIEFNLPYSFYANNLLTDPGHPIGDQPVQNATELAECQPYPWDVNVRLQLADGQDYYMEQQLAIGLEPLYYGDVVEPTVHYVETNSLLTISLYCTYGGMTNSMSVDYATITAILLTNNIPATNDQDIGWDGSLDVYTNWTWPLTPGDMAESPSNPNNDEGAAGTVKAQLSLGDGPIENRPLLVGANRAYELILTYGVTCFGGLTFSNEPPLIITNTGVVPPCTNLQFVFYTTNCECTNSPKSYCQATNTGQVDMLGAAVDPPGITVWANGGYATTLAGPGTFYLPVTFLSPGPATFSKWATEYLGTNTAYEYFSSPWVSVVDQCEGTLDMSNDFVMCPTNPGIVEGTVTLNGCVDTNYYGGAGALSFLEFAVTNNTDPGVPFDPIGDPDDPSGNKDLTLANVSFIQATGGESAPGAPVFSSGNGDALVEFDNPGAFTSPNTYTGNYTLQLAGLDSGECYWNANDLHLVFGSPVNLTYDIYNTASNLDITCGAVYSKNLSYCFGLTTISVTNTWPTLPIPMNDIWTQAVLQVSGAALDNSYKVGTFTVNQAFNPATSYDDVANVQLFLPEGNYQYTTTIYTEDGEQIDFNTTNYFSITNACCSNPCECVPAPTNMVLWLPFDETGGTTAINLAPGGVNGTKIGAPNVVLGEYVDNGLNFDGSASQYVSVPDYPGINIVTSNLTIDAWVLLSTEAAGFGPFVILDKRASEFGAGYSLSVYDGALIQTLSGTNISDTNRAVMADGQWHFVAVTVNQSGANHSVQFFVDGNPTANVPLGVPIYLENTNNLWVAASPWGGNQPWMGDLDEVEVYDRALATSELEGIYNAGHCGKCKPPCDLEVECPTNIIVSSCTNSVPVFYPQPTVTDNCCSNWNVAFDPTNGTSFPPDTTNVVTCSVYDNCGNSNSCSFTVTVNCETNATGVIHIATGGNSVIGTSVIYWPYTVTATNYILESTTNLSSPNWVPVTNYMPILGGVVTNNLPAQFYRLYNPNP